MWSFFDFLNDDSMVTVLDVRAAMTEPPPYQKLIDARRACLIGFEPDADACKKLNETFGELRRFYPYFVGDGKPAIFHETNWDPTGSLFEPNTPLLDKFHWLGEVARPVGKHPVTTKRLDDIDEIADVDFLKIDVQGSELAVFQNASRVLADAVLIQTEVSFVELYKQQPMFSDVDAFLRSRGYQFHDILGLGARSFKPMLNRHSPAQYSLRAFRQKIWADVYYVKDWMHLDRLPPVKLKRMAALLHDLAGSYDLAYVALQEMDKQSGTQVAVRYLERLEDGGHCVVDSDVHTAASLAHLNRKAEPSPPTAPSGSNAVARAPIVLMTSDEIAIYVPASLMCITTYVLLEQEQWFEKEIKFILRWLKIGMNAVDIGANVGVFSLPMARRVGPVGKVFAFEPGSENRRNLEAGRMANILRNLRISGCALSDSEKQGWLQIAATGELNSLRPEQSQADSSEQVRVTTMDVQEKENGWPSIDFVKIDAEGQEGRIIAGGRDFFSRQSPLVMYEVKQEGDNSELRWTFEALGYGTYRLLGDTSCLVPVGSDERMDVFELNLFAIKPDRAAGLAADGFLVSDAEQISLTDEERNEAIDCMLKLPYAQAFEFSRADILDCDYGDALVAYAAYRFLALSPDRRYAALRDAFLQLHDYCADSSVPAAQASLARVALDYGYRHVAVDVLNQLIGVAGGVVNQPFFPACERYEHLPFDEHGADWFSAASIEQLELSHAQSSAFSHGDASRLNLLCDSPFASAAISRRMILKSVCEGRSLTELRAYIKLGHSHGNAAYWSETGLEKLMSLL